MGYTREYWEREGARIAEQRRLRYQSDAAYREAAKDRSRAYRERKKAEQLASAEGLTVMVKGVAVPAMTSDQFCAKVGIERTRLKYLHKVNYLPPPLVTKPFRLYTQGQVPLVQDLEAFLRANAAYMRSPQTERGAETIKALTTKTTTIAQSWET
jgi:hypothetical protein